MDIPSLDKNRRPTFSLEEWRVLTRKMEMWVKEGKRGSLGHVGRDRYVTQQYVLTLSNCGARVGDLRYVRWNDIQTTTLDDGTPIGSMKKGFTSVIQFCGLEFNNKGERRTLYSLRHFYATQRLSEEVSPYMLASNMGTSAEMLERFYGHVVNDLVAAEITKDQERHKTTKSWNKQLSV